MLARLGGSLPPRFESITVRVQIECEDYGVLNPIQDAGSPQARAISAPSRIVAASAAACCTRAFARVKKVAYPIATSASFKVAAMVVIVANAALLSLERYSPDAQLSSALRLGNYALTALFACEIAVRVCAFGRDFWVGPDYRLNWVESFILLVSIVDVIGVVGVHVGCGLTPSD